MYDPQAREQAKTLYAQRGAAYAAEQTGIPERTIRRWALTEGWQLSGIYTGASGLPITPFLGVDVSGTGELNDRPLEAVTDAEVRDALGARILGCSHHPPAASIASANG